LEINKGYTTMHGKPVIKIRKEGLPLGRGITFSIHNLSTTSVQFKGHREFFPRS